MRTQGTYKIPARLGGKECKVLVDLIDSRIPLLLGKTSMSKTRMTVDYGISEVKIGGRKLKYMRPQQDILGFSYTLI